MKRYCAYYTNHLGDDYPADLTESDGGDLVAYADHAAFVERVREIAKSVSHHPRCTWHHTEFCNCPRGQLLEVCNG